MSRVDRYLKLMQWAARRYTTRDGRLFMAIGGRLTAYARIEHAAWLKYLRGEGPR